MELLFVCTGNTCRSPMAEAILRRLVEEHGLPWAVRSAGIQAEAHIAPSAVRALRRRGLHTGERAAVQLTEEMVRDASLVLCMTEEQRLFVAATMPACAPKVHTWAAFVARMPGSSNPLDHLSRSGYDIADPAGGNDDTYEGTAKLMDHLALMTIQLLSRDH